MDVDLREEWRQEMLEEERKDRAYEIDMRTDLDYALDQLGAGEISERLEKLQKRLSDYGWEVSYREIYSYL